MEGESAARTIRTGPGRDICRAADSATARWCRQCPGSALPSSYSSIRHGCGGLSAARPTYHKQGSDTAEIFSITALPALFPPFQFAKQDLPTPSPLRRAPHAPKRHGGHPPVQEEHLRREGHSPSFPGKPRVARQ